MANKVAQALGRKFLVYDASKAMFEDVLGSCGNGDSPVSLRSLGTIPVFQLKHGVVEPVARFATGAESRVFKKFLQRAWISRRPARQGAKRA